MYPSKGKKKVARITETQNSYKMLFFFKCRYTYLPYSKNFTDTNVTLKTLLPKKNVNKTPNTHLYNADFRIYIYTCFYQYTIYQNNEKKLHFQFPPTNYTKHKWKNMAQISSNPKLFHYFMSMKRISMISKVCLGSGLGAGDNTFNTCVCVSTLVTTINPHTGLSTILSPSSALLTLST